MVAINEYFCNDVISFLDEAVDKPHIEDKCLVSVVFLLFVKVNLGLPI